MDRGGCKLDHLAPWVWQVSLLRGEQWHQSPLMTTVRWYWLHGGNTGKQSLASCLIASLPERWRGKKKPRLRKPLPIVLLPSLVVVSTVCSVMRVPLFLFCCSPTDLGAVMFWQIVSKSHQGTLLYYSEAAQHKTTYAGWHVTPKANKCAESKIKTNLT